MSHHTGPAIKRQRANGGGGPASFEQEHVHNVYATIATHFSSTRYQVWPQVRQFIQDSVSLMNDYFSVGRQEGPPGLLLADIGCGNGKNMCVANHIFQKANTPEAAKGDDLHNNVFCIGSDVCINLMRASSLGVKRARIIEKVPVPGGADGVKFMYRKTTVPTPTSAQQAQLLPSSHEASRYLEFIAANALATPLRAGQFNLVLCIAVLHHIAGPARRRQLVHGLLRLARPPDSGEGPYRGAGRVLIYVWAREGLLSAAPPDSAAASTINAKKARKIISAEEYFRQRGGPAEGIEHDDGDVFVPWEGSTKSHDSDIAQYRYYHLFAKNELESMIADVNAEAERGGGPACRIVRSYYDKENWCTVLERM